MTTEKRPRRSFPEDFKGEAVSLITEQGYSVCQAARSLDIHENVLRKWKRHYEHLSEDGNLSGDERAELKRLRRENRELRVEKEILKKASAYFAKEMK